LAAEDAVQGGVAGDSGNGRGLLKHLREMNVVIQTEARGPLETKLKLSRLGPKPN